MEQQQCRALAANLLAPNPIDHPNFSGSNPALGGLQNFTTNIVWQASGGNVMPPWDVDNDGDGRPDSVWIDLGYPVQSTADGRLYKPLFAILCIDLDGRLNVNTSGTAEATANTIPTGAFPYAGTTGTAGLQLPRGEGLGPSEIDVTAITSASNVAGYAVADFKSLSVGKSGVSFDGRYGTDTASGKPPQAGTPGVPDKLGLLKHFQFPDDNFPASLASLSA